MVPATPVPDGRRRIAFLGPPGTFGEEALLSQPDLADADVVALSSHTDVLRAVDEGEVDLGFAGIENSIEGTVNQVLDGLVFDRNLHIQREVVLFVTQNLLGAPGATIEGIRQVVSHPTALGQCRAFMTGRLGGVEEVAATSTAEAARIVAERNDPTVAAIAPALAGKLYGLDALAPGIEDHDDNATRFVLVSRPGPGSVPPASGHDKTSIVCFQKADVPGSLHAILGQFAARGINLTKLESRPTKRGLGDYCFIIDLEGHIADELVADCLRELHASLARVKFLGSYPAAGEHGETIRRDAAASWAAADAWMQELRAQIA